MFAGRTGHARRGILNSGWRGKAPRAWNLARGVSDDLRGAVSSAGLYPSVRTLGRSRPQCTAALQCIALAAARTSWKPLAQLKVENPKVARDLSAPNVR